MRRNGVSGFTLLEVLIVVVIAVLVTMFAVPSYRKAQDRNRFMSATGVLMDIGNASRMVSLDYPDVRYNGSISSNADWTADNCPEELTSSNVLQFLQCRKYLNDLPLDSSGHYQGYTFKIGVGGNVSCRGSSSICSGVACMLGSNSITQYTCAAVDQSGVLTYHP